MDLAQNTSSATQVSTSGNRIGRAGFAAGVVAVVMITVFVAYALVPGSRTAPATVDQLVGPAAIEFRLGEHGITSTQPDSLVGSSAIQFRADERSLTSGQSDPLVGPAAIEFRAGEHE